MKKLFVLFLSVFFVFSFALSGCDNTPDLTDYLTELRQDVYHGENGDISLSPYEYGFIGGASGVFRDKLYFIGDLRLHRDAEKIENAARLQGLSPVSLGSFPLIDLGKIIFIDSDI